MTYLMSTFLPVFAMDYEDMQGIYLSCRKWAYLNYLVFLSLRIMELLKGDTFEVHPQSIG